MTQTISPGEFETDPQFPATCDTLGGAVGFIHGYRNGIEWE